MNLEKEPGEYTIKEIDDLYASGQLAKATYILLSVLGTPRTSIKVLDLSEYPAEIPDYYTCFKCHIKNRGDWYLGIWDEGKKQIDFSVPNKRYQKLRKIGYDCVREIDLSYVRNIWSWDFCQHTSR